MPSERARRLVKTRRGAIGAQSARNAASRSLFSPSTGRHSSVSLPLSTTTGRPARNSAETPADAHLLTRSEQDGTCRLRCCYLASILTSLPWRAPNTEHRTGRAHSPKPLIRVAFIGNKVLWQVKVPSSHVSWRARRQAGPPAQRPAVRTGKYGRIWIPGLRSAGVSGADRPAAGALGGAVRPAAARRGSTNRWSSARSASRSTAASRPKPAIPTTSTGRPGLPICTGCARWSMRWWSASAPRSPTIRSSPCGASPARSRRAS